MISLLIGKGLAGWRGCGCASKYPIFGLKLVIFKYLTNSSGAIIFSLVPLNSKMVYRPSFERYAVSVIIDGFLLMTKVRKKMINQNL